MGRSVSGLGLFHALCPKPSKLRSHSAQKRVSLLVMGARASLLHVGAVAVAAYGALQPFGLLEGPYRWDRTWYAVLF